MQVRIVTKKVGNVITHYIKDKLGPNFNKIFIIPKSVKTYKIIFIGGSTGGGADPAYAPPPKIAQAKVFFYHEMRYL